MKILVLGGGVIGVSTAYYLARSGHEVEVVDRQPATGMETSFANAGQVSPGYASPWARPGVPRKVLQWLAMKHRPFVLRPSADPALWQWLWMMLRNCTDEAFRVNKSRMVRLADYSRECLRDVRYETGIAYDHRERGTLQLFRTMQQLDEVSGDIAVLRSYGVEHEVLDPDGCIRAEPGLAAARERITGGLRLPGDETGDAHRFTQALAKVAEKLGVRFRFGTHIKALRPDGDEIAAVVTDRGELRGDLYVCALGSYTPLLLKPIGITVPVYPVKGYSLTIPIADAARAPVSTVMDETYKVGITRLGERIRVGGTAELAGYDKRLRPARRAALEHSVSDLFAGAGDLGKASFWTGLRPMTPDGTPVIGPTRYRNLHLNTGHGTLGWTMACGSGRLLADIISGRTPNIEHDDLSVARYRKAA